MNPELNAIVTLVPEMAQDWAAAADEMTASGATTGPLHGLPIAHKDLEPTRGIRTTLGSPLFADWIPDIDGLVVERLRSAGAVTIGKTNTPEFGRRFADVQSGVRRHPQSVRPVADVWRLQRGSGGRPRCGSDRDRRWLGHGRLVAQSGIVLQHRRPAPVVRSGAVVADQRPRGRASARRVRWRAPSTTSRSRWRCSPVPTSVCRSRCRRTGRCSGAWPRTRRLDPRGLRVAWSPDLGLPVDPAVRAALADVPDRLAAMGCEIADEMPDLSGAREVFQTLRAWHFEISGGALYDRSPDQMKDTVRWNIELARSLELADHARASVQHGAIVERVRAFFDRYDVLALPTTQVVPFDVELDWPRDVDGQPMETYIDWMRSCCDISTTGCPAVSMPASFTPDGLPVGVQFVGRPQGDVDLLRFARLWERAHPVGERRATVPVS